MHEFGCDCESQFATWVSEWPSVWPQCPFCDKALVYRGSDDGAVPGPMPSSMSAPTPAKKAKKSDDGKSSSGGGGSSPSPMSGFPSAPPSTATACDVSDDKVAPENKIVSCEILHGDAAAADNAVQWVNVPVSGAWRGLVGATHNDRLGNVLRLRLTFANAGPVDPTISVELMDPPGLDCGYSRTERRRNRRRFDITAADDGAPLDGHHQTVKSVRVPVVGGRSYRVTATSGGESKTSNTVIVWRKIFFRVIAMRDVTVPDLGPVIAAMRERFIDLVQVGADRVVDGFYQGTPARNNMVRDVLRGGPNVDAYRPHLLTFFFTWDYVRPKTLERAMWLNFPADSVANAVVTPLALPDADKRYLWHGVFATMDPGPWVNKCFLVAEGANPGDEKSRIVLDPNLLTPHATACPDGHYNALSLDKVAVRKAAKVAPETKYRFCYEFNVANSEFLGLGPPDTDVIFVAGRPDGRTTSAGTMRAILLHEIGHKLGMVPDGTDGKTNAKSRSRLDKPDNQYEDEGKDSHQGSHCKKTTCIMYGAADLADPPTAFCKACILALHKADFRGWVAHPNAPDDKLYDD